MCLIGSPRIFKTLKVKEALPMMMSNEEKDEFMKKVHNVILLCLANEVLREVVVEDMTPKVWLKL